MIFPLSVIGGSFEINTDLRIDPHLVPYTVAGQGHLVKNKNLNNDRKIEILFETLRQPLSRILRSYWGVVL